MAKPKNLIDKELMYQKIMPSSLRSKPTPSSPVPPPTLPSPPVTEVTATQQKKELLKQEIGISLHQKQQDILINIMEGLVISKLESAFAKFNCCKCDRCKKDVAALALNTIPPKYMVSNKMNLKLLEQKQDATQITTGIVKAILLVRDNPRH